MDIKHLGKACFIIKDSNHTILMDPHEGVKSQKADIVTASQHNAEHGHGAAFNDDATVFDWPGEYESKGVHVRGIHSRGADDRENTIYALRLQGINICHLGALNEDVNDQQTERIGDVDVLFIPVGNKDKSLDAKKAKKVIEEIEPRLIIPMMYGDDLDPVDNFLAVMGAQNAERVDELKLKKSDLPEDTTKIIVVNPAP